MKVLIALIFCSAVWAQRIAFVEGDRLSVKDGDGPVATIVESGSPHALKFSGDGAWIAFLDGDQLGVVKWTGGEVHHPLGAQPVNGFKWGGEALAIVTEDSVYLTTEAGGWTASRVFAGDPESLVFKADGKQMAISSLEAAGDEVPPRGKIQVISVDGSSPVRTIQMAGASEQLLLFAWPGDTIIAWKGEISGSAQADGFEVWAYSVSGGHARKLGGPALVNDELHAVSPDGKMLALTGGEGRVTWTGKKIIVANLETGESKTLTSNQVAALYPAWSPGGDEIAFITGPDAGDVWGGAEAFTAMSARHLSIMNADGSGQRPLTTDAKFRDERPVWTEDGKALIFVRVDREKAVSIWTMDPKLGEARMLAGPWALSADEAFGNYGGVDWYERIAIATHTRH